MSSSIATGSAWSARQGITIQRVLSDNGACYKSGFTDACAQLGI